MDVLKLLEDVKNDKVSLEEAAKELKQLPYEDQLDIDTKEKLLKTLEIWTK